MRNKTTNDEDDENELFDVDERKFILNRRYKSKENK